MLKYDVQLQAVWPFMPEKSNQYNAYCQRMHGESQDRIEWLQVGQAIKRVSKVANQRD